MSSGPSRASVVEERLHASVPSLVHEAWTNRMPWLLQGTSTRGDGHDPFDLGLLAGATPDHVVRRHWDVLVAQVGVDRAVVAPQAHGAEVKVHRGVPEGVNVSEPCDGHVTDEPGVLLTATVADCVPVFMVSPLRRAVAVLHAGWRGAAACIVERGLSVLVDDMGVRVSDILVHLGPSICGACYEVGPEVFAALGQSLPDAPQPMDLRGVLAGRAAERGVPPQNLSVSAHCTRCTGSGLFSHRGGDGFRQVGYIGIRAGEVGGG